MRAVQWVELSIEALGNEGVPKLAGCFKYQLQHWVHFAFNISVSQHFGEFLCVRLNGLSSVLKPLVTRGYQSWLDASSTSSNSRFILLFFLSFFQHSGEFLCMRLNGMNSMLEPSVMRWFQSWIDA
jgi:hypothetical protein